MMKLKSHQKQAMVEELVQTMERFHREVLGTPQAYEAIHLEIDAAGRITILIRPQKAELPFLPLE
ncbi:hypothetical protein ACUY1T_15600 [Billgrantia sp. Q4P2]|uniref:hypothetical protein n=1 Tax=Billgrantia sp. Q4P2 TaxID=3463857 RepID=UPI00405792FE